MDKSPFLAMFTNKSLNTTRLKIGSQVLFLKFSVMIQ